MNDDKREFEEVNEKDYKKPNEKILVDKDEYERMSSHYEDNNKGKLKGNNDNMANLLNIVSWIAFAVGLIPFFPYKSAIMAVGIASGYMYSETHGGSRSPMVANIVSVIIRLIIWALVLLFLPLWAWWTVLFM